MIEGKPVKRLPKGLDHFDWFCLMMYERYHWSYEQCCELPLLHADYIPIVTAAVHEIHEQAQRNAEHKSRR